MPIAISIIVLVAYAVLAWRDFKLALTLIVALTPAYLLRFNLVIPWTVLEGMILVAFAAWAARYVTLARQSPMPPTSLFLRVGVAARKEWLWPLIFLLAVASAAVVWAPNVSNALGIWKAYFIEPALIFIMLRSAFTDRTDWMRALIALAVTTIGLSILAIFQKLTGIGLPIPWDVERRATSIFEYPNALGLFVAPIVSALLVLTPTPLLLRERGQIIQLALRVSAIVLGLVAIVLAKTEAALVAIPVAGLLTLLMAPVSNKVKILVSTGTVALGLLLLATQPGLQQKIMLEDYSGGVRRSQWSETIVMLKDKPLQGAGLAGYPSVFEAYHDPRLYEIFQYPHTVILNFWVEMGILGVIAFIWITIIVCKLAWQHRHNRLALAAFAALATMAIHGLVDVPFFKNDLAVLTVFFLALLTHGKEQKLQN